MDPQKFDLFDPSTHPPREEIEQNPEKWLLCSSDLVRSLAVSSKRLSLGMLELWMEQDPARMVREDAARKFSERTLVVPKEGWELEGGIVFVHGDGEDAIYYSPSRAPQNARKIRWGFHNGWEEVKE